MKFMVKRASYFGMEYKKPCANAYRSKYDEIDIRTTDDPGKIAAFNGNEEVARFYWYKNGKNHRKIGNRIARDFEREAWFVDIDSLEALIQFQNENEKIIIEDYENADGIQLITIYDDWIE